MYDLDVVEPTWVNNGVVTVKLTDGVVNIWSVPFKTMVNEKKMKAQKWKTISHGLTAASVSGNYGRIVQIAMHWKTKTKHKCSHQKHKAECRQTKINKNVSIRQSAVCARGLLGHII